jgi:hypothetical protein
LGKNESRPSKKYNGGNKESFLKYQKRSAKLVGSSKKKVLEFIFSLTRRWKQRKYLEVPTSIDEYS